MHLPTYLPTFNPYSDPHPLSKTLQVIHKNNLALSTAPNPLPKINFKSVLIGNGLTNAKVQFASVPEYACDSEYAVYDDPNGSECQSLRQKMKRCEGLVNTCYK
jgi:cathepsin A (carboxypeptidase C)